MRPTCRRFRPPRPLFVYRGLAVLAVALVGCAVATAAVAFPNLNPPYLKPGCRVTESSWSIDCRSLADDNQCIIDIVEQVQGPCQIIETPATERFETVLLDGTPPPPEGIGAGQHTLVWRGRRLILPTVHVTGSGSFGALTAPGIARHPRLHAGRYPQTWRFSIDARPTDARTLEPRQQVRLRLPEGCGISAPSMDAASPVASGVWRRQGDQWVGEWPAVPTKSSLASLDVEVYRRGHVLRHGGPLLAAGAAWGNRESGLLLRAEYEGEFAGYFLPGVAVDFDSAAGWVLSPRLEVSTSQLWGLPMLGLGVGAPLDPANGTRSQGVRVYGSLHLGTLGLVFGADQPIAGAAETRYALLLRGSM